MFESLEHPRDLSLIGGPAESLVRFALALPQCVCIYDAAGRCVLANASLLRWLGRAGSNVQGQPLSELWPGETAVREAADLQLVLEGGRIEQGETRSGADGERAVRVVKFPWTSEDGQRVGMVVVFDELPGAATGSLAQPETIGRLALGIVHDFNNALTLLRGQLSLVEPILGEHAAARTALDSVRQVLDHACQLPRQLLSFIRNEPLPRQRLDLNALLAGLEGLLRPRLVGGATLEFHLDISGAWIEADPVQLTQVLLNLAGNALDAMPAGGRLILETQRVTLASGGSPVPGERPAAYLRVTIQDSGCGIAPDVLPRIFEPLFTTRPAGKGAGLGLAIVNEVVHRHGGWITCQSAVGQGTRFVIHLPAVDLSGGSGPNRPPHVLILERDPDIRQLTALILEQGPFHTETAGSLPQALERVNAHPGSIDLVLISVDLCLAAGEAMTELMDKVRGAGLLVTTSGEAPFLPAACKEAFRGVVPKPYSAELLLRAVQAALWGGSACTPSQRS